MAYCPMKDAMVANVFDYFQILWAIICFVTVDMVDLFPVYQSAP